MTIDKHDVIQNESARTRIVIADDSQAYLELLRELVIRDPQFDVVGAAADGVQAVRLAVEEKADVALLDIEMPRLDGFAAAEAIRWARPEARVILHTGGSVAQHRRVAAKLSLPVVDKLDLDRTLGLLSRHRRPGRSEAAPGSGP
jgi:CheY-like chemotaxis protein